MRPWIVLAACATHTAPPSPPPPPLPPPPEPARVDLPIPSVAMGLALHGTTLVWADQAGEIYTMPSDGASPAKKLTDQHVEGYAFHPFVAGDHVYAKVDKDLLDITLPDGPVARAHVTGLADVPEEAVADASAAYVTIFKRNDVLRIRGRVAEHLLDVPRGVLALHGNTLYIASYSTGALLAFDGKTRTITTGLARPTALAADDAAVYVYTEKDEHVTRIDLASGARTTVAEHLHNADELVRDGDALYTVSWPSKLVRLLPDNAVLADDLASPRSIVTDARHVYVTSDKPPRIVRLRR